MGVLERLSRVFVSATTKATQDATAGVRENYLACVERGHQLRRHAELAPQAQAAEGLAALAAAEEQQAARLREALRALGENPPTFSGTSQPHGALNHWGRLVHDLEAHRLAARRLRELATHFAESQPETAQLFDTLCREEMGHCEQLRELIARADPQALD